jgi:transcription factor E2F7/8
MNLYDMRNEAKVDICIDFAASELSVERRRIYDIVSILESVNIASRRGKNQYVWNGLTKLNAALMELTRVMNESGDGFQQTDLTGLSASMPRPQQSSGLWSTQPFTVQVVFKDEGEGEATQPKIRKSVAAAAAAATATADASTTAVPLVPLFTPVAAAAATVTTVTAVESSSSPSHHAASSSSSSSTPVAIPEVRKEQSLGHLSQTLVMMFLSTPTRVVTLDDAGKWLLGGPMKAVGETEGKAQANYKGQSSRARNTYSSSIRVH